MKRHWPTLCLLIVNASSALAERSSAVFLHPDGMGLNTWAAVRLWAVGADGRLAWDRLPRLAVYVGPMSDRVTASSNGGATSHAWGVRAETGSYGFIGGQPIPKARSGATITIMVEAMQAGKAVGIVNSAAVTEPGTGAFLAQVASRKDQEAIAAQILAARPDVIFGGGEQFFLPDGERGYHGVGVRKDGRNLIDEARRAGYRVVHTHEELAALTTGESRVLGLFAAGNTFNDGTEESLASAGQPVFQTQAPRFDKMIDAAIAILSDDPDGFLLVGNEEATDNMAGDNNAAAVLEAGAGADRAIATVLRHAARNASLTLVVASDSDCGGMIAGPRWGTDRPVAPYGANGAPVDGVHGRPFMAAPDQRGRRLPFVVHWASGDDMAGGLVARGIGPGAALIEGTVDSRDVYSALYLGLFGKRPD